MPATLERHLTPYPIKILFSGDGLDSPMQGAQSVIAITAVIGERPFCLGFGVGFELTGKRG